MLQLIDSAEGIFHSVVPINFSLISESILKLWVFQLYILTSHYHNYAAKCLEVKALLFDGNRTVHINMLQHVVCSMISWLCVTCRKDFGVYRSQLKMSILPYLNSGRHAVTDTCHLVIIFVGILVLVDILGTVLWIYLKRCVCVQYYDDEVTLI